MAIRRLLLAKIESTFDTDANPDDTNAIETINLQANHYTGPTVERDLDRYDQGNVEQVNVTPQTGYEFGVQLSGSGAAGTPPPLGVLLRACGFTETINAGVDVQYAPATSNYESATLEYYEPEIELIQNTTGVRGSVSLSLGGGSFSGLNYTMTGTYNRPVQGAPITVSDWSAWKSSVVATKDNTPTATVDGYAACTESVSIDWGIQVAMRDIPNCRGSRITDKLPSGSFTVEAPNMNNKEFFAAAESHNGVTQIPFQIVLGTVAGNIVTLASTAAQITNVEPNEADNLRTHVLSMNFLEAPTLVFT